MKYASTLTITSPPAPVLVDVETAVRRGIPRWSLNAGASGMMDRVRSAIIQSGFSVPFATILSQAAFGQRPVPHMDLALAVSILRALELLPLEPACCLFVGELSLSGQVRPVPGILWMLLEARRCGVERVVLPADLRQAALVPGLQYWFLKDLRELSGPPRFEKAGRAMDVGMPPGSIDFLELPLIVKRAFTAAAAGWHHSLLIGPPGTGKSTLAALLPAFLPPPNEIEALEIAALAPAEQTGPVQRPVRSPHHSASIASLIGGSVPLQAGEATRAHNGLLILDELAEFSRAALQALREPLSSGIIQLSRGREAAVLPARFLLAATTNPCPCGQLGNPAQTCSCKPGQSEAYLRRITGPLLDRIEIELDLRPREPDASITTEEIRRLIAGAWRFQEIRFQKKGYRFNGRIPAEEMDCVQLSLDGKKELLTLRSQSQRKLHGILRVARTLADLGQSEEVRAIHVSEAASFACVDEIRVIGRGNA
jgi:magnesium chelatase family protein